MESDYSYGKTFGLISNKIKRKIEKITQKNGLSAIQGRILGFIYCEDGRDIYQKDIEEEFELRGSSVTSTLSNLEKQGFVIRTQDFNDQRLKKIVLTKKAITILSETRLKIEQIEKETFSCLLDDEKETLKILLEKILKNIEKY